MTQAQQLPLTRSSYVAQNVPPMNKPFSVAVLGQGNVGSEVIRSLQEDSAHLEERAGRPVQLEAIHRRDPERAGEFFRQNHTLYRSIDEILDDPNIDLVCELMGGIHDARRAIEGALDAGKHVVSANKELFASHWPNIVERAKNNNVQVRIEAAVAGGVPILHALSSGTASENVQALRGIINGTTNYILTQMAEHHLSYQDCLADAQRKGYAEKDPSSDVLGRDACQKLSLLIAFAFGRHIRPEKIPTMGIADVTTQDIEHAASMNPPMSIKLVGRAELVNGQIIARVGPELVLATSPIGLVPANLNAIEVRSNFNGIGNFYQGEGAGGKPTASAVLSDILHIARFDEHGFVSPFGRPVHESENQVDTRKHTFYVRFVIRDAVGVIHDMTKIFKNFEINLNSIVQLPYDDALESALPFYITVENTDEQTLQKALDEISVLPFNVVQPQYIRFERDDLWKIPKKLK